ncbi:MAG: hypothetical protein HYY84_10390 [Deltaproteobacteria bacterium]|nr:hypothetical protein [Deltaproteobacteria bacterium]
MKTNSDIERYLLDMGVNYESPREGIWVVHDDNGANLVVMHAPPVTVFRVKLAPVANDTNPELYRNLLQLNATQMVAGAYGIEDNDLVITDTLQSENLDRNEFRESVDGCLLAAGSHFSLLAKYLRQNGAIVDPARPRAASRGAKKAAKVLTRAKPVKAVRAKKTVRRVAKKSAKAAKKAR